MEIGSMTIHPSWAHLTFPRSHYFFQGKLWSSCDIFEIFEVSCAKKIIYKNLQIFIEISFGGKETRLPMLTELPAMVKKSEILLMCS